MLSFSPSSTSTAMRRRFRGAPQNSRSPPPTAEADVLVSAELKSRLA